VTELDAEIFKKWDAKTQEQALAMLKARENNTYVPFFCPDPRCSGDPHGRDDGWDHNHARPDQRPPSWTENWLTFLMMSGRGGGKTKAGSEITHQVAKSGKVREMAMVGVTGPDFRETMVEGPSGILATSNPAFRPLWEPSRRRLLWPNGFIAHGYSAEEADRIRGANVGFAWLDEGAFMDDIDTVWMNLLLALRIGENPHVMITTTPRATKWLKELVKDPQTILHRVSTYENLKNLSGVFRETVLSRFEGTRQGQQELYGEILEDVEGALWNNGMFKWHEGDLPAMSNIIIAVDPAGSANKRSDETGIAVIGIEGYGTDFRCWVIEDVSGKYSPKGWATLAVKLKDKYHATCIVAEKNYGGDMVKQTLKSVDEQALIILVDSRKGKDVRATPVVGLYEQGKVIHYGKRGDLMDLEDEQTSWIPGESPSPNRIDAVVHGITHLTKNRGAGRITMPGGRRGSQGSTTDIPRRPRSITQAASTLRRRSTVNWSR
jgi:phage terminase large subunit-like protein